MFSKTKKKLYVHYFVQEISLVELVFNLRNLIDFMQLDARAQTLVRAPLQPFHWLEGHARSLSELCLRRLYMLVNSSDS